MLLTENGADNSAQQLTVSGYENAELAYPTWYANGLTLLVTNYTNNQPKLLKVNINSLQSQELTYQGYWSGMGTVNLVNDEIIAYGGQSESSGIYNQNNNKICMQIGDNTPFVFSDPAEGAIGRAPWFCNDGQLMAFEAMSGQGKLQIFIKSVDLSNRNTPIIPVGNGNFAAQHAKFSPDGSQLVWVQNDNQGRSRIYLGTIDY